MAFPGGLAAAGDASLRETAVRETHEEIDLDLAKHGRSLGTLSEQLTLSPDRHALVIRPFVFELSPDAPPPGTSSEVVGTHWIDLAFFDGATRHTTLSRRFLGIPMRFECHRFEGRAIWGLTLRMIRDLKRRVDRG
jgi:8-oxo-dGTP pyrophosphatase MutT (NUDIX family)